MPSLGDSAVIFILALLLFGPKKLPELARQLGKLMAEFRRASNEFRMQMEDELRIAEQAEQQKKIAAMEAAAPVTPAIAETTENTIAKPAEPVPAEEIEVHPHLRVSEYETPEPSPTEPLPIASSGELNMMPPSTGLPEARSSVSHAFDSVPHVPDPELNPPVSTEEFALQQKPDRHQAHDIEPSTTEASLHG
jgi:sec-independent protein translocase protein TatB